MKITYIPKNDELILKIFPKRNLKILKKNNFKIWYDKEYTICALSIKNYTKELEKFKKNKGIIQLRGICKGKISEKDISKTRKYILKDEK
jgi:hypothetical protein